eukprot:1975189-Amphidinium_carterae.2
MHSVCRCCDFKVLASVQRCMTFQILALVTHHLARTLLALFVGILSFRQKNELAGACAQSQDPLAANSRLPLPLSALIETQGQSRYAIVLSELVYGCQ